MDPSTIYSQELSHYKFGRALWYPEPDEEFGPARPADVGYIRDGQFHRLFSASLPADHASHKRLGVPEGFEPLLGLEIEPMKYILDAGPLCSETVRRVGLGASLSG